MGRFFKKVTLFIIIPLAIGSIFAACGNNDNPANGEERSYKRVREETGKKR